MGIFAIQLLGTKESPPLNSIRRIWLRKFNAEDNDGRGAIWKTDNVFQAKFFNSTEEAMAFYHTQSKRRPLREDGKPNKPLTAYHIAVVECQPKEKL